MLLNHLGEKGTLNDGIRNLVNRGLDPQIKQALDNVRATGNNAAHPEKTAFNDMTDVQPLSDLVNINAEILLTRPKRIQGLSSSLPGKKQGKQ